MLGRLIQGYSKVPPSLESATEEAHSRSLLWPHHPSEHPRGFLSSPPHTPVGSPTFRVGQFDDRGGLELNDPKDVRIIIAQDAFGSMDRPMVLFDTQQRAAADSRSSAARSEQPIPWNIQQRHRSTTISGPSAVWSRPNRDSENCDKVNRLLDCMFGVTSATKSESSTKMHVLFSTPDQSTTPSQTSPSAPKAPLTRTPLLRSRTSVPIGPAQKPAHSPTDEASGTEDVILVTRMFTVALPESKEQLPVSPAAEPSPELSQPKSGPRADSFGTSKRPKLVEKKIPMYAIGLLLTMPPEDVRATLSRPPSRTSLISSSFPNSLGSDIASSWTLLDTIPDSLGSSTHSQKHGDRRIEFVTNIWDVILRTLTGLEHVVRSDISALLQQVNREIMASMVKTPKGPQEQRTNQRNIYIRNPMALAEGRTLQQSSRQALQRILSALRIPRVVTGTGFHDGHWLDEARYLVQIYGSKPQNFFFFNLLTAFLGNHTEWLEKLGAHKSKKSVYGKHRRNSNAGFLPSRTVIIAERRSIARRLIFLLASFLPTPSGVNALEKDATPSKSPLPAPGLASSPLKHSFKADEIGQESRPRVRNQQVSFSGVDVAGLSTSASSGGSMDQSSAARKSRPRLDRNDSDATSIRAASMFPIGNYSLHLRKASAANSATTPQSTNPIPYFATKGDSYFPEDAIVDGAESVASADLARILRRDSSSIAATGMPSPKWPALLSGFWPKKQEIGDGSVGNQTSARASFEIPRRGSTASSSQLVGASRNKLQGMVSEANGVDVPRVRNAPHRAHQTQQALNDFESESAARSLEPPRLRVDEQDGVIDVDVGIAGFMSWEGDQGPVSPPRDYNASMSAQHLGSTTSLRSSMSHTTGNTGVSNGENLNVAGFLKRYHEDFILQAVRPYEDLQEEIKQSMLRESSLLNDEFGLLKAAENPGEGEWIDICSTLIADLRKYSIEQVILRGKRVQRLGSGTGPSQDLELGTPGPSAAQQHFVVEPVVNFDMTLADAIESILDTASRHGAGGTGTKVSHKRTISSSTTASTAVSTPPSSVSTGYMDSRPRPQQLRANCRQVLAEALEEVVKSVKDDMHQHEDGRPIITQGVDDKAETSEENVLREGVRRWLLDEETRAVW